MNPAIAPNNLEADAHFERLLKHEDNVSNLLAFLAALDPEPLAQLLGIPAAGLQVRRETNLTGKNGRSDFIVWNEDAARAIVELKVAAVEHGDQLSRYEAWADEHSIQGELPVQCLVVDLLAFDYGTTERWQRKTLSEIACLWDASPNDQARLLASSMRRVFDNWEAQLDYPIGAASSTVVATMAVKRASTSLLNSPWKEAQHPDLTRLTAFTDSGGNPATYHFIPFPNQSPNCWLSLDIRAGKSGKSSNSWAFRMGVDVDRGQRPLDEAKDEAWNLAQQLQPYLDFESFHAYLESTAHNELAKTLQGGGVGTGFQKQGTGHLGSGFYQDGGLRLASQFCLDAAKVSPNDLTLLMQCAFDYLHSSALDSARPPS